jgi:hypothetical protein
MAKTPTKLVKGQQALTRYFAASPDSAQKAKMKKTGAASSSPSRRSLQYEDDEEVENKDQNTKNNTKKTRSKPRGSASPAKKRAKKETPAVDDDDEEEERKDDAEANEPKYDVGTKVEKVSFHRHFFLKISLRVVSDFCCTPIVLYLFLLGIPGPWLVFR